MRSNIRQSLIYDRVGGAILRSNHIIGVSTYGLLYLVFYFLCRFSLIIRNNSPTVIARFYLISVVILNPSQDSTEPMRTIKHKYVPPSLPKNHTWN